MGSGPAVSPEQAVRRAERRWNRDVWSALLVIALLIDASILMFPFTTPMIFALGLYNGVAIAGLIVAITRG